MSVTISYPEQERVVRERESLIIFEDIRRVIFDLTKNPVFTYHKIRDGICGVVMEDSYYFVKQQKWWGRYSKNNVIAEINKYWGLGSYSVTINRSKLTSQKLERESEFVKIIAKLGSSINIEVIEY